VAGFSRPVGGRGPAEAGHYVIEVIETMETALNEEEGGGRRARNPREGELRLTS